MREQDAIKHMGGCDEFLAAFGEDHAINQRVNACVLDADRVAGAFDIG
jgi:hypothetical protein